MIRIAFFAVAFVGTAAAQAQVFKCMDPTGRIVYSQNPCPPSMKRESMSKGGIPPASAAAPAAGAADSAAKSDAAKSGAKAPEDQASRKRQQDQAKAAKDAEAQKTAQAQQKEANCRNARQRLAQYEIGGRISQINEKGERYYMEDAQIESEKARARADVAQSCS